MDKNVKNDNVKVESQKNEHADAAAAEKDKKFKEQKAAAAKAFKERKAAEKKSLEEIAKKLLPRAAEFKFTAEETALLQKLANPAMSGSSGQTFFNRVFGDSPKVGDSIKLLTFFEKTMKSKADLDKYVKQWAEKGIVVELKQAANQLESTYTIKALPSA